MKKDIVLSETIDKNGTKHQIIKTTCDRCGGLGGHPMWDHTGYTCFKCGGSGRMEAKQKIYTPEHEAKLEKQRQKRAEKKREKALEENKAKLEKIGYGQDKIFLVIGDTFKIKDELKKAGARFNNQIKGWFFTEKPELWETVELETSELVWYNTLGQVFLKDAHLVSEYVEGERRKVEPQSEYVGKEGDQIEIELEFIASFFLESNHFLYNSSFINKMKDDTGNIFIWKTSKDLKDEINENGRITLKGRIKEHNLYRDEKQTILTRCRIQKEKGSH
ncbi:hypothetical protein P8822_00240 [Bacillus sonorensis]|uniref:hypothetical protein n=1 Tax=Bacillus sonorensis TaxID=119858 RepID=UPI002DBFB689|nr:hypothetical protein [Bacillus sonorensis]MEC0526243.1 hypothetical protein [Bacillus sonorensis]